MTEPTDDHGDDYRHPGSGRVYRPSDPAHIYALALRAARSAAEQMLQETATISEGDYLRAFDQRPTRSAYRLRDALDFLFHAEQGIRNDRHRREPPDDDWQRKYGPLP